MPQQTEDKRQKDKHMKLRQMDGWQRRRLLEVWVPLVAIFAVYLAVTVTFVVKDRLAEAGYWDSALVTDPAVQAAVDAQTGATEVTVGTYIENVKDISLKNSSFTVVVQAWFRWQGDDELDPAGNFRLYKGTVSGKEMLAELTQGDTHYQLVRFTGTVSKNFWTRRFPLESHQLRFYLESDYLADRVHFVADTADSGMNEGLSVNGFELRRHDVAVVYHQYGNALGDPTVTGEGAVTPELCTAVEINRSGFGLYAKCFIALLGTITWVLVVMFVNTYHHVDPLGMIPAALFGTVSNIMVGANLLPDALELGLLEYVNLYGVMTILAAAISVINVNRIRNHYGEHEFADLFGRCMFYTVLGFTLVGHVLLPCAAYMF